MGIQTKTNRVFAAFSRAWRQILVFASNSDWLVVLFTSVVIGQSNYFGFGFTTLNWKPLHNNVTTVPYFLNYLYSGMLGSFPTGMEIVAESYNSL